MSAGNARGSATLEAGATTLLLFTFISGLLLVTYVLFARVWVQYQSEQALYCLAEGQPRGMCRQKLLGQLRTFLPWGTVSEVFLSGGEEPWKVGMKWSLQSYVVHANKRLTSKMIGNSRALP